MESQVRIKSIQHIKQNVLKIITNKPKGFGYMTGLTDEILTNAVRCEKKDKSFTFSCRPENDFIEITINMLPSTKNISNELLSLKINDELVLHDSSEETTSKNEDIYIDDSIEFISFTSFFRYFHSKMTIGNSKLNFINRIKSDIILQEGIKKITKKFSPLYYQIKELINTLLCEF